MYATKFTYNGHFSDEYGIMIGSFNGGTETASGGEIEITSVLPPNKDEYDYYGNQIPNALVWNFTIIKNRCTSKDESIYFNLDDERHITKWLMGEEGYHELFFHQEEYTDICYMVCFNIKPHQIGGRTVGFDVTATSNCGYGFTQEYIRTSKFLKINDDKTVTKKSVKIQINNDLKRKIYPFITIKNGKGSFTIENLDKDGNTICKSIFNNINSDIIMDSKNDIITGIPNPDCFVNWGFLYFIDGANELICDSDSEIEITIKYREIRRVII